LSSLIGGGGSFSVVFVYWSPSRFDSLRSSLVGGDLLVVSVWGVVSFLDSGSLFFGKFAMSSSVSPESTEEEESDEDIESISPLFCPFCDFKVLVDSL
jgi:hypothetical protein